MICNVDIAYKSIHPAIFTDVCNVEYSTPDISLPGGDSQKCLVVRVLPFAVVANFEFQIDKRKKNCNIVNASPLSFQEDYNSAPNEVMCR